MNKLILAVTFLLGSFTLHKFHITYTLISYNENTEQLEISMKIPIEDLELAFEEQGIESQYLGESRQKPEAENYVRNYVDQYLKIWMNQDLLALHFMGMEMSEDMHDLWIYLEPETAVDPTSIQSIKVKNTVLMELFNDQNNTISIGLGKNKQKILELQSGRSVDSVTFN
jgi:hypothetical protein